ncbi:TPA: hypothetical protein RJR39_006591, partial [Burkholderia cenocepacia]|nr:hypothetical protein [Burkholderia cenocepacia]
MVAETPSGDARRGAVPTAVATLAAAYRRPRGRRRFSIRPCGYDDATVAAVARRCMNNEDRLMRRRTFLSRAIGVAAASLFARTASAQHAGHAGMAGMDSMDDMPGMSGM